MPWYKSSSEFRLILKTVQLFSKFESSHLTIHQSVDFCNVISPITLAHVDCIFSCDKGFTGKWADGANLLPW